MDLVKRIDKKMGCKIAMPVMAFALSAILWAMTGKWPMIFILPGLCVVLVMGAVLVGWVTKHLGDSAIIIIILILVAAYLLFLTL
jgi:hypothetical protein